MPCYGGWDYSKKRQAALKLAREQVRAKFPDLQEKSSGWERAVHNRYLRNL